ncbi:hypothetical protein EDD21DRAFT_354288 [Dissophora ornata]|nr:hypothetical protein EDD21DRAFT_354288 [Dissophora ornata]
MFNNLLKKASESSFAAMASEALDSRPGSPASAVKRQPGSPLSGQQPFFNRNLFALTSLAKESERSDRRKIAKNADQLKDENETLNEELQEARAVIKAMRATLEDKATDEFLSPKPITEKGDYFHQEGPASVSTTISEDPLGVSPVIGSEKNDQLTEKADVSPAISTAVAPEPSETASATPTASVAGADTSELEAKVKDLLQQLSAKTEECKQLEGTIAQRTSEVGKQKSDHDEKMKKMKAIFAAANKNLNEYRQSIAAKDEEIAELKARLENPQPTEEQTKEQSQAIQDLEAELKAQSEAATTKLQQMVCRVIDFYLARASYSNIWRHEKLKVEYQQYKQRASTLLQQQREAVQTDDDSKLRELQNQLDALTKENRSIANELQEAELKRTAVESELQAAMDQIASLESSHEISRRQERQQARQLKDLERSLKDVQRECEAAESRIASIQELRAVEAQSLMQELGGNTKHIEERLAKKEEENAELQKILDRSSDELAAARQEIQNLRDLVSNSEANFDMSSGLTATNAITSLNGEQDNKNQGQLHISTTLGPRSSFSPYDQDSPISRASSSLSLPAERPPVYSTLSDLLAAKPLVERPPFGDSSVGLGVAAALSSAKEREYQVKLQHLTELLNESEANHQRLLDQEKACSLMLRVLKEEVRNLDRAERRQNLSVDYLKNIVLKYLETSDKEPLLPVLTTVLQLSPAEVASLRKKTVQPSASSLVLGGLFGGGGPK